MKHWFVQLSIVLAVVHYQIDMESGIIQMAVMFDQLVVVITFIVIDLIMEQCA